MSDIKPGVMYEEPSLGWVWAAPLWNVRGLFKIKVDFRCGHCAKISTKVKLFWGYPTAAAACPKCDEMNIFPYYSKPGKIALSIRPGY